MNQYAYTILVGLQNYPSATKTEIQFSATVLAKPNSAPQFTSPVQEVVQLTKLVSSVGQQSLPVNLWNFFLPSFEDADVEDTVTLSVDLGSLSNFASYDSTNKVITILDLNAAST